MNVLQQLSDLPLHILDLIVIIILLVSAFLAYMRGFVHEILSISGWGGAIFATYYGLPIFRPFAENLIDSNSNSSTVSLATDIGVGIIIFVLTLVILSYFTKTISKSVQRSILNSLDRALGFLFGLLRGSVLICVLYLMADIFIDKNNRPDWMTSAKSLDLIIPGANTIRLMIPESSELSPIIKATKNAQEKTKELLDAKKTLETLISPQPKSKKTLLDGEYKKKEIQDMERLIDSNQPRRTTNN